MERARGARREASIGDVLLAVPSLLSGWERLVGGVYGIQTRTGDSLGREARTTFLTPRRHSSRVRPGMEEAQLSDLRALGLDWDGPILRQSERMELYEEAIARLDSGPPRFWRTALPLLLYARGDPGRRIRAARHPCFRPLPWHLP